jgi:hypothetical protein
MVKILYTLGNGVFEEAEFAPGEVRCDRTFMFVQ